MSFKMNFLAFALLLVLQVVVGDVLILKPTQGLTFTVSGSLVSVDVEWSDDGTDPNIDTALGFTFTLCTGLNSDITAVKTIASSQKPSGDSYTAEIAADAGSSGVYFIQVYTTYPSGYTIHYSKRFTLSGMTGLAKSSGLVLDLPPAAQISAATTTALTATMDISKSLTLTYTVQTGPIRFAPMQMQPGSTVTATTWTRQFPTSAVTYFSVAQKTPDHILTITPGWLYTKTSYINQALALGLATGAYEPSKVLKKPVFNSKLALSKRFD